MTPKQSAAVERLKQALARHAESTDKWKRAACHQAAMMLCTPDTIRTLLAALDEAQQDAARLRGESAVLLGLLADCNAVLRTIDPDDCDEAERLADLRHAIYCAQTPSTHQGALL